MFVQPRRLWVWPVLLVLAGAASCDSGPSGVSLGVAAVGTVDEIVEAPGSVTARAAATVSAPADGTLASLRVAAGDRVSQGDVVAIIDSPALQAREKSAADALDAASGPPASAGEVSVARDRTDAQASDAFTAARAAAAKVTDPTLRDALLKQVDVAQRQYAAAASAADRALQSVQRGVATLGEAVDALTSAQRLQAEQAYDLAAAAVDALTLKAPVSGVVQLGGTSTGSSAPSLSSLLSSAPAGSTSLPGVDEAVPQGAHVAAGTPLLTVVDVGRLGLTASVDETDVLLVKPGTTGTVELDAAAGAGYDAVVRSVDLLPTTSAQGGVSYKVRLDLRNGANAPTPRPGMSAVVRLTVREATGAVTVPASAVVNADGHDNVWTVRDGRYRRTPVTLGVQGEDAVQVTAGVTAGERIVVSGADKVKAGDKTS